MGRQPTPASLCIRKASGVAYTRLHSVQRRVLLTLDAGAADLP